MSNDPYTGFHRRMKPDYNGRYFFDVFKITEYRVSEQSDVTYTVPGKRFWYWQPYDGFTHVGMMEGPFQSPYEAYKDAMGEDSDEQA